LATSGTGRFVDILPYGINGEVIKHIYHGVLGVRNDAGKAVM